MATATFNGEVIAESDDIVTVEGNPYFPLSSIKAEYFSPTAHSTSCYWKGTASYYAIEVDGDRFENGAWYYPEPLDGAQEIADRIAFYNSRVVIDT